MSEEAVIDPPETFTEKAVPLLKEYREKLIGLCNQLRELKQIAQDKTYGQDTAQIVAAEASIIQTFLNQFRPAARRFGQQVSGMIDQGRLSPLERVELQLRLAEFESILDQLPRLVVAYHLA